jgi:hypothetical protein
MVERTPRRWTEFISLRMSRKDHAFRRYDKLEVEAIARDLGVRSPAILRVFDKPAEFDDAGLPDAFVLKPVAMTGKRGVMVLRRLPDRSGYFDLLGRRRLGKAEIVAEQQRWRALWKANRRGPYRLIAQEMVVGENGPDQIPLDYKTYAFNGVVKLIQQIDRNAPPPPFYTFHLGEFGASAYPRHVETDWTLIRRGTPVVPRCRDDLIRTAKAISLALKTPFISVDLYAGIDGPVLGELTSTPGTPYFGGSFRFTPEFDEELGREWLDALDRLGMAAPLFDDAAQMNMRTTSFPRPLLMAEKSAQANTPLPPDKDKARRANPRQRLFRLLGRAKRAVFRGA